MKNQDLRNLVESVTVSDLKDLMDLKGKIDSLEKKRAELQKSLTGVDKEIEALQASMQKRLHKGKPAGRPRGSAAATPGKAGTGRAPGRPKGTRGRKRGAGQLPLDRVVQEVLEEKKKPMRVSEICDAVLGEKKYRSKAKNFKGQLRIVLYKNEKGFFKKEGPGLFGLARSPARGGS